MKFGYARVSTKEQNLDLQMDALQAAKCDKLFMEKVSGSGKQERPELERLLDQLREGDILVIYKLDRLGRSTSKLIGLSEDLQRRGIDLVSLQDQLDTTTAIGKAMFRMMMVMAEMERDILVERTQAGLQAARRRGRVGGRPRVARKQVASALTLYAGRQHSVSEIEALTGIKAATLYRYLKANKQVDQINPSGE